MAKYPYIVNKNGVWYQAGQEVPDNNTSQNGTIKAVVFPQPFSKTEINRMSKDDLVALAIEQGIENAKETSGADLKKALIEKFGL